MKCKAAILYKLNEPLIIEDIEIPSLKCGQVLVKVHCSSVCGAQIGEITGAKGEDKYLPHLLGHEGGGVVCDIGEGVTQVKKEDHVVLHWRKGLGIEAPFPKYKCSEGVIGGGSITTFNEYAVVSENRLTVIKKLIPFEIAALMGCSVTTGLGLINNEAQLKIGQSIVVIGCGGVGLNVIQGASMVSANPIIAIDRHYNRLLIASNHGATHSISNTDSDVDIISEVLKITGKKGADVVVDCTGVVNLINLGYKMTSSNGRMILVGQPKYNENLTFSSMRDHYCGKTIMDSQGGLTNPNIDIPQYLNLYLEWKLHLDDMISHRFPLEKVNDALDLIKCGIGNKFILRME